MHTDRYSSLETLSDGEIAAGLARGCPDSFRALYAAHGQSILAYLSRMTGRKEMAEELTQETFLTAIRKIGFFRAGPDGGLKPWVFRIATNLAIDALRRDKRVELRDDAMAGLDRADAGPGPDAALERFEFTQALGAALLRLGATQRTIFLLREQEEMTLLEISRVCGCSENAVKQSLFRSRAALRKTLCE